MRLSLSRNNLSPPHSPPNQPQTKKLLNLPNLNKIRFAHVEQNSRQARSLSWCVLFVLSVLTIAGTFAGAGRILNIAFPVMSLIVGLLLFEWTPGFYISYAWWLWFLTPLVRRLADYHGTFTEPSPMLLAPYLVSLITVVTLYRNFPKAKRLGVLPLAIALVAIIYGMAIGLLNRPAYIVLKEGMDWLAPVSFGFYLAARWRDYPMHRSMIQKTFCWGVLFMGIYGINQYLALPAWDRLWVVQTGLISATGNPDNGSIRVWSTMQSGEPFAAFMAAALLVLLGDRSVLAIPASVTGYLAFLLSFVRSGWLSWIGGLLVLIGSLRAKQQMRLILMGIILFTAVLSFSNQGNFSEAILDRLMTLGNLEEDGSAAARRNMFHHSFDLALMSFLGEGIGGGTRDNLLLALLFDLGWVGALPYVSGLGVLIWQVFNAQPKVNDPFLAVCRSVVATALIRLPVNGSLIGVSGIVLWGFLGLGVASIRYSLYQQNQSRCEIELLS